MLLSRERSHTHFWLDLCQFLSLSLYIYTPPPPSLVSLLLSPAMSSFPLSPPVRYIANMLTLNSSAQLFSMLMSICTVTPTPSIHASQVYVKISFHANIFGSISILKIDNRKSLHSVASIKCIFIFYFLSSCHIRRIQNLGNQSQTFLPPQKRQFSLPFRRDTVSCAIFIKSWYLDNVEQIIFLYLWHFC